MAAYQQHVATSGLLGIGYGTAAVLVGDFTPVQGGLAACLAWVSGMLPDLDSDSGKPIREVFSLLAAIVPVTLMPRLEEWGGNVEGTMALAVLLYVAIRYGAAAVLARLTVHRGMFHSIPAMLIAAQLAFLAYKSDSVAVRLLMASAVALGFLSHLVLDEIYSVSWSGVRIRLNKMAGSALKFTGRSAWGNLLAYGMLFALTYVVLLDTGWLEHVPPPPDPEFLRQASEEAPLFR